MTAKNTSAASTANAAAAVAVKAKMGLFTRKGDKHTVAMFINTTETPRAPIFGGMVNGVKASAFVRHVPNKQSFLSIVGDKIEGSNLSTPIANANVRIVKGTPKLAMVLEGTKETVWVSISKNVSNALLEAMGCNLARLGRTETAPETAAA